MNIGDKIKSEILEQLTLPSTDSMQAIDEPSKVKELFDLRAKARQRFLVGDNQPYLFKQVVEPFKSKAKNGVEYWHTIAVECYRKNGEVVKYLDEYFTKKGVIKRMHRNPVELLDRLSAEQKLEIKKLLAGVKA